MRLSQIYAGKAHARVSQNLKKVPLKQMYPLTLKEYVDKGTHGKGFNCLYELSMLFTCLKTNDYLENNCAKEIKVFRECSINSENDCKLQRKMRQQDLPQPGAKSYTNKQISFLLRKYPTV